MNKHSTAATGGKSWVRGIVGAYLLFVTMTLSFVFFAFSQRLDLVSPDYYQREIAFQQHIDRVERTRALPSELAWSLSWEGTDLICAFPPDAPDAPPVGTIHLYRPANADLDRQIPIDLDANGRQRLTTALIPGHWRIKISWKLGTQDYFSETALTVRQ